jgi:pimeloyl-ACP methyl ester carboxylesterase
MKSFLILSRGKIFVLLLFFITNYSFSQHTIDSNEIITIGGIKQFIKIKSKDDSKPLLLLLHGGPGGSLMNKTDQMTGRLQEHFVVVQWDQRETGETLKLNKSPKPLRLQMFFDDTHDLIDSLLKRFHQPKLYLIGYSWGTGLGFYIAEKYPQLLYAYISVSSVIDQRRSDSISLAMLKETMGNKARKELSQVQIPFQNAEQLYLHRKWLYKHDGQIFVSLSLRKSTVESWAATWFNVWSQSCDVNRIESLPVVNCPIYFFAGEKDYNTSAEITKEYFRKIAAPKKDLFVFGMAGHGLPETHSEKFQDIIIGKILPATITSPR